MADRKRGRPKAEHVNAPSHTIAVRVTEAEWARMREAAAKDARTVTNWLRALALKALAAKERSDG